MATAAPASRSRRGCSSGFVKISQHRIGCAFARNNGTCENRRTIRYDPLEDAVLSGGSRHLMDDEHLAVFCDECTRHLNRLRMVETGNRARDEAILAKATGDLDRLFDALIDGVPAERVKDRMAALEAQKAEPEARLAVVSKEPKPLLRPTVGARDRKAVAELRDALGAGDATSEALEIVRGADRQDRPASGPRH